MKNGNLNDKYPALPSAVFGKDLEHSKIAHGYDWIIVHDDFPKEACTILGRWLRGFQWRLGTVTHSPAFAWLPVDTGSCRGGLVIRLLDIGNDDRGRPHCLRVEGLWIDSGTMQKHTELWKVGLNSDSWPEDPLLETSNPSVTLKSVDIGKDLLEQLSSKQVQNSLKSVLIYANDSVILTDSIKNNSVCIPVVSSSVSPLLIASKQQSQKKINARVPGTRVSQNYNKIEWKPPKSRRRLLVTITVISFIINIIMAIVTVTFFFENKTLRTRFETFQIKEEENLLRIEEVQETAKQSQSIVNAAEHVVPLLEDCATFLKSTKSTEYEAFIKFLNFIRDNVGK